MNRILIAEDEPHIVRFLVKGLQAQGYTTAHATDGNQALLMARTGHFDLLLLDLGLPGRDGLDVLAQLRTERARLPVVVLTARSTPDDIVAGLDGGADDYMSKPFRLAELLARVRARLRPVHSPEVFVLSHGDLSLDLRTRQAQVGSKIIDLSAREYALAEVLMRHPGQVLSREQLLSHVWGYDYDPGSNVVEVYIRYLRNKIGPSRITTVRGIGYRLAQPSPRIPRRMSPHTLARGPGYAPGPRNQPGVLLVPAAATGILAVLAVVGVRALDAGVPLAVGLVPREAVGAVHHECHGDHLLSRCWSFRSFSTFAGARGMAMRRR